MTTSSRAKASGVLTPLELQIMQVLWTAGPSPVAAVQERLGSDLAYTTVQTMLNVLLRKKKVRRTQVGRAFTYEAAVSRDRATGAALKDLVSRMFGGSGEAMLMALVNTQQITPEQLTRAAELVKRGDDEEA
ncbi:BlaI/MecI/CopY family transcriptional regulator [Phenylobacterium sp.]|uniref:BlaI/MecI/CopY family transcriptional regulator n=1 Tax=Phenylobacterium sp. TaxID=1871053 RepID=UPI002C493C05|nr:BlaI/MecI/CopY family transcriptional regulator [Phenylobacterium sp.]HLZ76496.1 BlaI/MecI/CopY family transcriptional regulator [Phenylobacterium sp.]